MKIVKIVSVCLLFVFSAPTVISSIYTIDSEFLCCEKTTEEEKQENKSEKDFDSLEDALLAENQIKSEHPNNINLYLFRSVSFIDVVSDIIIPPPEIT